MPEGIDGCFILISNIRIQICVFNDDSLRMIDVLFATAILALAAQTHALAIMTRKLQWITGRANSPRTQTRTMPAFAWP